jgi:hypothetical protein
VSDPMLQSCLAMRRQGEYVERKREAVQAVYEVRPVPGPTNKVRMHWDGPVSCCARDLNMLKQTAGYRTEAWRVLNEAGVCTGHR